jgi:predicted nucleic acid-binding protein
MNECRLVLDTNIFVAAGFEPKSASARLLEALRQGRCRMIWHQTTRRETERVLRRIPPLDWRRFAPLFRPEWEHPDELDLTPFGRSNPDDRNLLRRRRYSKRAHQQRRSSADAPRPIAHPRFEAQRVPPRADTRRS